jgi:branched-chain amino acid transport system ATP-binding protein
MTPAGLVVDAISVRYGSIRAIQGASLVLSPGIVALVGSNGAGKSSLVKAIAGLVPTAEGSVRTRDGRDLTHMPSHRRVRELGIVLVPEGRGVLPSMTVAENLEFGLRIGAARRARGHRPDGGPTTAGLLELFPQLHERYRVQARYLSGGEQQMLSIARALAMEPEFLLVDEPSLGLSPAIVASLFETIRRVVVERDIALLLIEQDTRAALALSDYAYVMERGRIELEGPSREIADGPLLRAAYLGAHEVIAR